MKYIVWIRERDALTRKLGPWIENGDGPVTQHTADRMVRELREDFGLPVRALPAGQTPIDLG